MSESTSMNSHRTHGRRTSMIGAAVMMLGSSYFDMAFGLVRGILVMNLLGPTGRGIMGLVGMAHKYLTHSHLGVLHGISKDLPLAIGRRDTAAVDEIEGVGAAFVTLTGILAGLGMAVFGLVMDYGVETKVSLIAGGGILAAQQVYALYRVVLRAWDRFGTLAVASVVSTLSQFCFILLGAALFHVSGAMLGWLLALIISVLYFAYGSRFVIPWHIDWTVVARLVRSGLFIAFIILSDTLLRTVDGLVIVTSYPDKAYKFGLYSVAVQVATYLYRIPEAGGFVIMPRILQNYAAKDDVEGVRRHVMLPTIASATILPVAAGCAFVLLPPMVRTVVPKFESAIYAAQVLSLASVLLALPVASNTLLIALNKDWFVVMNKCIGAAVIWGFGTWYASRGGHLSMIAMGAGIGYFVASLMSLYEVLSRYYKPRGRMLGQLAMCYLPLAWCVGALKGSGVAADALVPHVEHEWLSAGIRLCMFLIAALPVILYGNAKTRLLHEVLRLARRTLDQRNGNKNGK